MSAACGVLALTQGALVYAVQSRDVEHVIVDGGSIVRSGRFKTRPKSRGDRWRWSDCQRAKLLK